MKDYLTVKDIAERLDVTAETVRRWLRSGKLRGTPFGRAGYRIEEADFQAFLHAGTDAGQLTNCTARFLKLTATLSQALTAKQVADVIIRQGLIDLQANAGVLFLLNEQRTTFKSLHIVGYPQAIVDAWPGFPADAPLPIADAVRERTLLIFESLEERRSRYPHTAHVKIPGGDGALVALPLLLRDQPVGGLGFHFPHDRTFSKDECTFLLTLAEICAQALERACIYEELQHTNRAFRTLLETMPVGVVVTDTSGAVTFTNPIADTILHDGSRGHASPSGNGFKLYRTGGSSSPSDELPLMWAVEQGHPDRNIEVMIKRSNGTEATALVSGAPVVEEDGTIRSGVTIIQDISERKQAEMALQESEERMRLAVNVAKLGMWDRNILENRLLWTDQCKALFGLPADTVMSYELYLSFVHPEDRERVEQTIKLGLSEQTEFGVEYRIIWPDKSIHWVAASGRSFFDEQGRPVRIMGVIVDITERKRAEQELAARAGQLEAIFQAMADGVTVCDSAGHIQQINRAYCELFELDGELDSFVSIPLERGKWLVPRNPEGELLPQEHWPLFRALKGEVLAGPKITDILCNTWQGRQIIINAGGAPIRDASGNVIGAVAVFRDVTERKRIEAALQASEERYRTIVQTANEGIWLIDTQARTVFVNDRMAAMLGYSAAEMLERPAFEFVFTENQLETKALIDSVLQGSFEQFEANLKRNDGNPLSIWASTSPVRDGSGTIVGALGMFVDITERKRLEQRTHQALDALLVMAEGLVSLHPPSEEGYTEPAKIERMRHLADLTRHALDCEAVVMTLITPSTGIIEHTIASGFEISDEQTIQDRVQGKRLSDRFDDPHLFTRLRAGEVIFLDVTRPPYRDRQPRPHLLQAVVIPMRLGNELLGVISLYPNMPLHDYTNEEIALAQTVGKLAALVIERERLLREREEAWANQLALQETTRRMDEFIGIVSHELRTPLTTIKGNIQLAKRQLTRLLKQAEIGGGESSDTINTVKDLLDRADRQVGTQNRLVNDLLDVSRIQANHLELHLDWCNLVTIVRETVEDQRTLEPARIIHFESNVAAVDVLVDAERVGQVVHNYISNALKYSEQARPVEVRLEKEGMTVRVLVQDEGPGLAPEVQQRIWDRFYRAPGVKVESGTGAGLGLGLHICQTIIERQGGQVGVESTQGQGSTFWFTLPLLSLSMIPKFRY